MTKYLLAVGCALLMASTVVAAPTDDARAKLEAAQKTIRSLQSSGAGMSPEQRQSLQSQVAGQLADARMLYESVGALRSDDIAVLTGYAAVLRIQTDYDLAAETLARATTLAPDDPALWRQLGADYGRVGPATRMKAFDAFRQSLALDGEAAETYCARGVLYHEEGLFDLAHADYARALSCNPSHVQAVIGNAILDARAGKVTEGARAIRNLGLAAQAYDAWTRVNLREALYQYERTQEFFEDTADNHAVYAELLYRAARVSDAILAARHAVTLAPDRFETWNFIAAMQSQIGTVEQARATYEKSLEVNPDQPQVRAILEQIPPK